MAKEKTSAIAKDIEKIAQIYDKRGDLWNSRKLFQAAAQWFGRAKDGQKATEMTIAVAEGWVREALSNQTAPQPSQMLAARHFATAIKIYRNISRKQRQELGIEDRAEELHQLMTAASSQSVEEMGMFELQSSDFSKLINEARGQ